MTTNVIVLQYLVTYSHVQILFHALYFEMLIIKFIIIIKANEVYSAPKIDMFTVNVFMVV
jgi:hypothetical protein